MHLPVGGTLDAAVQQDDVFLQALHFPELPIQGASQRVTPGTQRFLINLLMRREELTWTLPALPSTFVILTKLLTTLGSLLALIGVTKAIASYIQQRAPTGAKGDATLLFVATVLLSLAAFSFTQILGTKTREVTAETRTAGTAFLIFSCVVMLTAIIRAVHWFVVRRRDRDRVNSGVLNV